MHTYRFGYNRHGAGRGSNGPPARHGSRRDVRAGLRGVPPGRGRSRTGRNEQQVGARCGGLYVPPVPGRLVERIRRWEFIEMFELLPELLVDQRGGEGAAKQTSRAK